MNSYKNLIEAFLYTGTAFFSLASLTIIGRIAWWIDNHE